MSEAPEQVMQPCPLCGEPGWLAVTENLDRLPKEYRAKIIKNVPAWANFKADTSKRVDMFLCPGRYASYNGDETEASTASDAAAARAVSAEEAAIARAVEASLKEEQAIARAVEASLKELNPDDDSAEEEAIARAIEASLKELDPESQVQDQEDTDGWVVVT